KYQGLKLPPGSFVTDVAKSGCAAYQLPKKGWFRECPTEGAQKIKAVGLTAVIQVVTEHYVGGVLKVNRDDEPEKPFIASLDAKKVTPLTGLPKEADVFHIDEARNLIYVRHQYEEPGGRSNIDDAVTLIKLKTEDGKLDASTVVRRLKVP